MALQGDGEIGLTVAVHIAGDDGVAAAERLPELAGDVVKGGDVDEAGEGWVTADRNGAQIDLVDAHPRNR